MPPPHLHDAARHLRRGQTDAEAALWRRLRARSLMFKFRRQHPIPPFVADFACVETRLVIEIDGGQHGGDRDAARDATLAAQGWRVLRYWSTDVLRNPEGVVADILRVAHESRR